MVKPIGLSQLGAANRLGAAIRAIFASRRTALAQTAKLPEPSRASRKRLWALVQTKPAPLVLLVSDSREDLEAEAHELNATWNHRDLRSERHNYEIQPVALLQTGRDPALRAVGKAGQQEVG